ncbi:hypothetical protein TTHERM_00387100 (macronuclear) [Tetrahymena thermophila SB210]|uniref:Uncharacterized protein n=1 Tax=Tetrahymena thermophila (strain SB210) TaxID=312017 RepID=Q23RI0_TETTS|nr:hypothetical protein TTHERM_00387100 [Tetrahymena thermophila SB210]EAR99068.2 hypothetical protein TTHERM_00387100 [Tetrahymena thermophila SB210]|eukprot:XP_001019313.2 hypothetical protein TTHERM_00387100 [Tetrahymena thermophila SB210]
MNQSELQAQYESIQNNIRNQFEEIEQLSSDQGDNKDLIIEKLVSQNQYIYNQYVRLYEKSLTIDDIAHLIDLSSRDEQEIKQYVQDQVRIAFEDKKMLEDQVGCLNLELFKMKERCLQSDQINDKNIYKKQLEDILNAYAEYRNNNLLKYVAAYKEINTANFKAILFKDLELITNIIIDQRGQNYATFQGNFESEVNQNNYFQAANLQQKLPRTDSQKSYEKFGKEVLSKKASQILNEHNNDKNSNISAILKANKLEIENELRNKLSRLSNQKSQQNYQEDDEIIEKTQVFVDRAKNEETGIKTIIKHSIQRLNAIVDEMQAQGNQHQSLMDSLRDELMELTSRIYTLKQFSKDEETEKWNKVVKSIQQNYEETMKQQSQDIEERNKEIKRLKDFICEYEKEVENMKNFINDIENNVKEKEDIIQQLQNKMQQIHLQQDDEQNFYQEQIEEKNNQVLKLSIQIQQITNQKNELLAQNSSFKDEIAKIEDQLHQMIKSKKEYEDGLDKEKEETFHQYNKLRMEYETEAQKFMSKIQEQETQIDVYKKQIQLKEMEMDEMQNTFNQLEEFSKKQLDVIKEQQDQIIKFRNIKEKNKQYKEMIQGSNEDIQNLKADFNKLINQTQQIQKELEMRNEEKQGLKEEIQFLKMRNDGYEKRIEVLERRNDELEEIAIQKEKQSQQQQQNPELNYFQNKLNQLESEKIQIIQENSCLKEQNKELTNKSQVLIQNLEQLQDQNEKSVDINTQLANERDLLQDKLFKLSDLITLNREKMQKYEQNIQYYQSIISNYMYNDSNQRKSTFKDVDNELSCNSVFNNVNALKQYQQNQNQYNAFQQNANQEIIVQQEYQPNSYINQQNQQINFENQQPIQFNLSNSNSKYQKISMFSQPFYQDNENQIQSSNFSNNYSENYFQYPQSDHVPKYSFCNPVKKQDPIHNQILEENIQEEIPSNQNTKRSNKEDQVNLNNQMNSKTNLSYSPFTVQNEVLNSDDTNNNSNFNQIKVMNGNNLNKISDYQIKSSYQNMDYLQKNMISIKNNEQKLLFNQINESDQNNNMSNYDQQSKHKLSLDEDLKKLINLHSSIVESKK